MQPLKEKLESLTEVVIRHDGERVRAITEKRFKELIDFFEPKTGKKSSN